MPLQASMTGLHGANAARRVNVPIATATNKIVRTATGLRRQLFSPSPKRKGKNSRPRITTTGPISRAGVSIAGGNSESTA